MNSITELHELNMQPLHDWGAEAVPGMQDLPKQGDQVIMHASVP